MSTQNYSLEIVSKHSSFNGQTLKKYAVDGLSTVGVWGNEPFEVVFKNHTWQKVQVKLSIDGTDILTGKPADTSAGDMWVVNAYGTLTLKAWPETNKAGAQFIFTSAEKSVAVNTHGDLSSRSIIAAAVYTESYVAPTYYNNGGFRKIGDYSKGGSYGGVRRARISYDGGSSGGGWGGTLGSSSIGSSVGGGGTYSSNSAGPAASMDSLNLDYSRELCDDNDSDSRGLESLKSLAAVGAGVQVEQKIQHTAGFVSPVLGEIVRVRYMWWDDLRDALRANGVTPSSPVLGFPGEEKKLMSIGSTPRLGQWAQPAFPVARPVEYSRF